MNILVTGASKGIGKVIAQELQTVGEVFVSARNENALKNFGADNYCVCDLSNDTDLKTLGDFIEDKQIDVLVNNAGIYEYCPLCETNLDNLELILQTNLRAPIYLAARAASCMKKRNFGRIVNIGSISGVMGEACAPVYSASKAGLIGFAKSAGLELAPFGITVNTINPGWVDTELGNNSIEESEFTKDEIIDCIPQRRFVEPVEIANLVKYLISKEAKGITGQSINLCAGLSVGI